MRRRSYGAAALRSLFKYGEKARKSFRHVEILVFILALVNAFLSDSFFRSGPKRLTRLSRVALQPALPISSWLIILIGLPTGWKSFSCLFQRTLCSRPESEMRLESGVTSRIRRIRSRYCNIVGFLPKVLMQKVPEGDESIIARNAATLRLMIRFWREHKCLRVDRATAL